MCASHLVSAAAHGKPRLKKAWELGDTGIIKESDKSKLSNEKHERTVIDLGKGGFGLGDEFELLGLDLVPSSCMSTWVEVGCLCVDLKEGKNASDARNKG